MTPTADAKQNVLRALGFPPDGDAIWQRILACIENYEFARMADEFSTPRAEQRKQMRKLRKHAPHAPEKAQAILNGFDYPTLQLLNLPDADLTTEAGRSRVARQAYRAQSAVPRTGAVPQMARIQLIRELAAIYENSTGRKPGGLNARFPRFVRAVFRELLPPHHGYGLADQIRAAINVAASTR